MEGDFSRFRGAGQSYSGVLMQQGRVQLDADWNEQWILQTESLRDALRDIIGDHGGPSRSGGVGFQVERNTSVLGEPVEGPPEGPDTRDDVDLYLRRGTYYVDGIRLELRSHRRVDTGLRLSASGAWLVYLEVWERHVNAIEAPSIREVALLGPDTATRAQVVWRVNLLQVAAMPPEDGEETLPDMADTAIRGALIERGRFTLAARASTVNTATDPCMLSPMAQYRGLENQLYRVEIHTNHRRPSNAAELPPGVVLFRFKWSRDNGTVVFPIEVYAGPSASEPGVSGPFLVTLTLAHLGRDTRFGLTAGDVVEFVNDLVTRPPTESHAANEETTRRAGALGVVRGVDPETLTVRVEVYAAPADTALMADLDLHPYLRRWDQRPPARTDTRTGNDLATPRPLEDGAVPVTASDLGRWFELEDGVQVCFKAPTDRGMPWALHAGDFWMVPARVATGRVEWPERRVSSGGTTTRVPIDVEPLGTLRHYAPLAYVRIADGVVSSPRTTQRTFDPLAGRVR